MSERGWVNGWAVSGVSADKLLNLWCVHRCLGRLIFCWPAKRSLFESAQSIRSRSTYPLIFPSNFPRNFILF